MMAMLWAQQIMLGKKTFKQVPRLLKEQVREILIDSGMEELVELPNGKVTIGGKNMKILLIAGHGAQDSGAVATIDGVRYREADLTREVVGNLKPLLESYGVGVGVYPTSHDAYTDYKNGKLVANANFSAYDYILEIHFNAGR